MTDTITISIEVPATKECTRCKRTFSYTEFAPGKSGLTAACRECRTAASQASKLRKKTGVDCPPRPCLDCGEPLVGRGPSAVRCRPCQHEHTRELGFIRNEKRKDRKRAAAADKRASRTDDDLYMEYRASMLRRFNLTLEDYDKMLESQGGVCAICRQPEKISTRNNQRTAMLAVDHDRSCCDGTYSCGKCVRGLLCRNHNTGLGHFSDNAEWMQAGIDYLNAYATKKEGRNTA